MENEDLEIEVSNVDKYSIFNSFRYIGMNQLDKGNIKQIRGTCIRDLEKKLYFVLKRDKAQSGLKDFRSLIVDIGISNYGEDILWQISQNSSNQAIECSQVMELLYLLEESGDIYYDVDKENILIKINGMESISGQFGDILNDIYNIEDNPKLSNVFARMGPSQDLSNKIHNDNDARKAAKTFSEGRKSLEDLLYFCITNNIKTFTCCAGHEEKEVGMGYVSFNLDDEFTRKTIKYINTKMQDSKCTAQIADLCYGKVLVEGIYCDDKGTEDEIFAEVLENLQEYIYNKDAIPELNEDNAINKEIDDKIEQKNNPKNRKSGFFDVIGAGIRLSPVQNAIQFVKSKIKGKDNPDKRKR